jgi:hypothetical protein
MTAIREAIFETLYQDHPQTVRGLFYQLVSQGIVPKTEAAYKGIVGRLAVELRRSGVLPYAWLADNTRWMRKPRTFSGLEAMLQHTAATYRRDLWCQAETTIEIWCEKDALAGVLYDVTEEWDVPLMVTRGYPSLSFLYSAAEAYRAGGRPVHLYYFGDFDPAGVDIPWKVDARLRELAPDVTITLSRMAVTEQQIVDLQLPTRPTKGSDRRAVAFGRESVELDAMPAERLRALVRACIEQHVDPAAFDVLKVAETSERAWLQRLPALAKRAHVGAA